MTINKIGVADIRSRAEKATATNQDCMDLLDYMDSSTESADFMDEITEAVERSIEDASGNISRAVERAIMNLRGR